MQINNFCCIGAELQNKLTQSTKMAQIYFYRTFEEETMSEMLSDGFFNIVYDRVKVNDLILLYSPKENQLIWTKVVQNIGGQVTIQYEKDVFVWNKLDEHDEKFEDVEEEITEQKNEIETAIKFLGNRSNIFEILPDEEFLNPLQFGKVTYTNIQVDSFRRIPVKTWLEDDGKIKNITNEFSHLINIGSLIVDERGSIGIVEEFESGNDVLYKKVVVTTISPQATLSKAIVGSFWFGKTKADSEVPLPTVPAQNYYDFTTGKSYKASDKLEWIEDEEKIKIPEDIDCQILITSQFWDILEQENQHGGIAYHGEITKDWAYFPNIYEMTGGTGHAVGEIVWTMETDISNKGRWCDGSRIAKENNPVLYQKCVEKKLNTLSASEWQAEVDSYGNCTSFGLDTENQQVIIPLIKESYLKTANDLNAGTVDKTIVQSGTGTELLNANIRAYVVLWTSKTDEVDMTESIKSNNPFFFGQSMYSQTEPDNVSWLKSDGNFHSGQMYEGMYNWILENIKKGTKDFKSGESHAFSNGTGNIWFPVRNPVVGATAYSTTDGTPLGVVSAVNDNGSVVVGGATYNFNGSGNAGESLFTDYDFRVNESNQTFKLPLLNGSEDLLSSKADNLNLLPTGNKYIAPANGWYYLGKRATAVGQIIDIYNLTSTNRTQSDVSKEGVYALQTLEAKRGDTVQIIYSTEGELNAFRFIYAQGNGDLYWYVGDTTKNAEFINFNNLQHELDTRITEVKKEIQNIDITGKFKVVSALPSTPEPDVFYFIPE